jgi:hypothetical protein
MGFVEKARRLADDFGQYRRVIGRQRDAEAKMLQRIEARLADISAHRAGPRPECGRNLVMGLAAGYSASDLFPFIQSLRGSGYAGDIALVTYDVSADASAFLASHGVRRLAFDSLPLLAMSMNSSRMLKYLEYLDTEACDDRYDYIMLSDVRDVVFQGDPFARVDGADLYYFLEEGRTIGACPVNARWMEMAFGAEGLRLTSAAPVSCAGTLIARPAALREYLLHMARHIVRAMPAVRHSGIDQAIHNYLMVTGAIANARVVENGGAVMTVPADTRHGVEALPDGRLRNADGSLSEVIHQYDRDPVLLAVVTQRYRFNGA